MLLNKRYSFQLVTEEDLSERVNMVHCRNNQFAMNVIQQREKRSRGIDQPTENALHLFAFTRGETESGLHSLVEFLFH